jgi:hypothetical protein
MHAGRGDFLSGNCSFATLTRDTESTVPGDSHFDTVEHASRKFFIPFNHRPFAQRRRQARRASRKLLERVVQAREPRPRDVFGN